MSFERKKRENLREGRDPWLGISNEERGERKEEKMGNLLRRMFVERVGEKEKASLALVQLPLWTAENYSLSKISATTEP